MLVETDSTEFYRCFWANDKSSQPGMFAEFCDAIAVYPNAILFHFGAYEAKALKEMREYVGGRLGSILDQILGTSQNVLSVVHHHCYFPTYSNRLKNIAGFLGYQFDNEVRSGIRSVIFRERWEETSNETLKEALIAYNRQDCEALKTVCKFVRRSAASAGVRGRVP
jgi:predicted RecB family nuclease